MKIIKCKNGQSYKICDCHYEMTKKWTWTPFLGGRNHDSWYVVRREVVNGRQKTILLHRWIMGMPEGKIIDHRDGDGLNNDCSNLRIGNQSLNNLNQKGAKYNSKSGYKGVYWHKAAQKWCAEVVYMRKKYYLGLFDSKEDARDAYNIKAKELGGEFFSPS